MRWLLAPRKGAQNSGAICAAMHHGAVNSALKNTPPLSRELALLPVGILRTAFELMQALVKARQLAKRLLVRLNHFLDNRQQFSVGSRDFRILSVQNRI